MSDHPKLLFLGCKDLPPFNNREIISGGMEVYTYELAKRLSPDVDISIIIGRNGSGKKSYVDQGSGCNVNEVPIYGRSVLQPLSLTFFSFFRAMSMARNMSVINPQTPLSALVAASCKLLYKTPYFVTVHSFGSLADHVGNNLFAAIYSLIEKITLSYADGVVTAGESLAEFLAERHNVPREKFRVIHSGMDITEVKRNDAFLEDRFKIKPHEFILLFLGRYIPENGIWDAIGAVRQLMERNISVKLYLAGLGELKSMINKKIAALNLYQNVIELGPVWGEEKLQLIERADIVLRTSYHEVFPVVFLEAFSVGTPVIATPVGDVPYIARDSGGIEVVPVHNPAAIANAVEQLKNNPQRLNSMAEKSKNYVSQISWDTQAGKYLAIINEVSGQNGKNSPKPYCDSHQGGLETVVMKYA